MKIENAADPRYVMIVDDGEDTRAASIAYAGKVHKTFKNSAGVNCNGRIYRMPKIIWGKVARELLCEKCYEHFLRQNPVAEVAAPVAEVAAPVVEAPAVVKPRYQIGVSYGNTTTTVFIEKSAETYRNAWDWADDRATALERANIVAERILADDPQVRTVDIVHAGKTLISIKR